MLFRSLQKLPVLFALDRAGLVGADGPTHNGSYDVSFLRCLPDLVLMAPADENECRQMLYTGFMCDGPAAVRYPRGSGMGVSVQQEMTALPIGRAELRRTGRQVALLAFGSMVAPALEIAPGLDATVVNMRFIKPLDEALILQMAASHELLVTLDENVIAGGAGSGVSELLALHGVTTRVLPIGLPDRAIQHGSREDMLQDAGLTAPQIEAQIRSHMPNSEPRSRAAG